MKQPEKTKEAPGTEYKKNVQKITRPRGYNQILVPPNHSGNGVSSVFVTLLKMNNPNK